uniref:C-C motif chemokine n=1 Tax=Castor canadensis TaxID=51338 RepID=A0A8B7VH78_CASCN|nr:C-C motif chemokine 15-like [Castor canadensis]
MEISVAALSFLILAAAFGSQALVIHGVKTMEFLSTEHQFEPPIVQKDFHQPSDCCFSYISRKIQCSNMEDYFLTSSGCSKPGIIFLTIKGKQVCADPRDSSVQDCMRKLKP